MRRLVLIPIVHSQEDMGSLGRKLRIDRIAKLRAQLHWNAVRRRIQRLQLNWAEVKVYQDGLPDTNPSIIEKILAEIHSPNYDVLRWLVAQGATLLGTEAPHLLQEEYRYLQAVFNAPDDATRQRARRVYSERADPLLAERDAYIARRIAETLPPDGIGLLFVGQAHYVARFFPSDVEVQTLQNVGSPPA